MEGRTKDSAAIKQPSEKLLHIIWEQRLYSRLTFLADVDLETPVDAEVLKPGMLNGNAGPDFSEARLRVGMLVLAGHVEVHFRASEWLQHGHDKDPAYDNTILHVVVEADRNVLHRTTRRPLLTCMMHFSDKALQKATQILTASAIGAEDAIFVLSPPNDIEWGKRALQLYRERLDEKCLPIDEVYKATKGDIGETLHYLLLRHMGAKVNNEAFELVARTLPLRIIRKHTDNLEALEALYLGQAGLLRGKAVDDYMLKLQEQYQFLASKYSLTPAAEGTVRLLRLRPAAFPHRRLAIMAQLRHIYPLLESLLLNTSDAKALFAALSASPSNYWLQHYTFGTPTLRTLKGLSAGTVHIIILNVVLPFQYYRERSGRNSEEALLAITRTAERLPPEKNHPTEEFRASGLPVRNALESQAVLQLKETFAKEGKVPTFSYLWKEEQNH